MSRIPVSLLPAILLSSCSPFDAPAAVHPLAPVASANFAASTDDSPLSRTDLGTLGGLNSYAAAISDRQIVVGWSQTAAGATHAFRWSEEGGMVDLGTLPGGSESRAVAILDGFPTDFNHRGQVVGSDFGGFQWGWIWSPEEGKTDLTKFPPLDAPEGIANAISPSGVVLITAMAFAQCGRNTECWRAYWWTPDKGYVSLGTPNNDPHAGVSASDMSEDGTLAGSSRIGFTLNAVRWDRSTGWRVLPHLSSSSFAFGYAQGANSHGTVVGADHDQDCGRIVATMWDAEGAVEKLSPDHCNSGVAVAVNSRGTIAGWESGIGGGNHAVIWRATTAAAMTHSRVAAMVQQAVAPASSKCLADERAIVSRSALFSCVIAADRTP